MLLVLLLSLSSSNLQELAACACFCDIHYLSFSEDHLDKRQKTERKEAEADEDSRKQGEKVMVCVGDGQVDVVPLTFPSICYEMLQVSAFITGTAKHHPVVYTIKRE